MLRCWLARSRQDETRRLGEVAVSEAEDSAAITHPPSCVCSWPPAPPPPPPPPARQMAGSAGWVGARRRGHSRLVQRARREVPQVSRVGGERECGMPGCGFGIRTGLDWVWMMDDAQISAGRFWGGGGGVDGAAAAGTGCRVAVRPRDRTGS
jgi:hypothetical protein